MIPLFTHGITCKLIYAWYSWYTIAGVVVVVLFTHDTQDLRMITVFTHNTIIYARHHMQTDTQLFTHDTQDLRCEELDLRMIHKITSFTHATWFTHGTHDTHKISFTHDSHDLRRIYAKGNPLKMILEHRLYLRIIRRQVIIYAWYSGFTSTHYLRVIRGLCKSDFIYAWHAWYAWYAPSSLLMLCAAAAAPRTSPTGCVNGHSLLRGDGAAVQCQGP